MDGMKMDIRSLIAFIAIAAIAGALAGFAAGTLLPKSSPQMITDFYAVENAASASPSDYIRGVEQGKPIGLLVDLRTKSEYGAGHFAGAVNVPAEQMTQEQLLAAFRQLPSGQPFITYCYTSYCMLSRNVGKTLSENGIYARHLTAGWYEINRDYPSYVVNGSAPGTLNSSATSGIGTCSPSIGGTYSC